MNNNAQRILDAITERFEGDFRQDLAVQVLSNLDDLPKFETDEDLNKYLSKMASNQSGNDTWTRRNRERIMEENSEEIKQTYGYNNTADDPLDVLLADELEDELTGSLSDIEKDIYTRVLAQGEPYRDVATELGMTEAAVRKHVSRIKQRFLKEQH